MKCDKADCTCDEGHAQITVQHFPCRWRRHVRKDRKARINARMDLLEKTFACWCVFVPLQRSRRQLADRVERKFFRTGVKIKVRDGEGDGIGEGEGLTDGRALPPVLLLHLPYSFPSSAESLTSLFSSILFSALISLHPYLSHSIPSSLLPLLLFSLLLTPPPFLPPSPPCSCSCSSDSPPAQVAHRR